MPRTKIVQSAACEEEFVTQFVALGAPSSTGKTSVLAILGSRFEKNKVINFSIHVMIGTDALLESLCENRGTGIRH